jgi:hypothetical protein
MWKRLHFLALKKKELVLMSFSKATVLQSLDGGQLQSLDGGQLHLLNYIYLQLNTRLLDIIMKSINIIFSLRYFSLR